MPPKPKFTREEIIAAAMELVSEKGISALTAKEIGDRLGVSARPVFTAFKNMEEVQQEVRKAARDKFQSYAEKTSEYTPAFKQLGMQVIMFAREEPNLYRLLFLTSDGTVHELDEGYMLRDNVSKTAMEMLQRDYDLEYEDARKLFHHVWIFTFGIGALYATGICRFTDNEINELLGQNFIALLGSVKSGAFRKSTVVPAKKTQQKGDN